MARTTVRTLVGACIGCGAGAALALRPVGDRKMYRGVCAVEYQGTRQPYPWECVTERLGYSVLPLSTLDEVTYANEIPFEPTPCRRDLLVPHGIYAASVEPVLARQLQHYETEGEERTVHAIFDTRLSAAGWLCPADEYSNLELRVFK
ncbi:hypothetical protein DIPPA_11227 [Diplonema papillatum]|nr:hypothetical protein DIPPA_11227 [Diplonema papillatum]